MFIIELGDCGWSYNTENESAANAIKNVVNGNGFAESDYDELDQEAKEIFDDFADDKVIWVDPNGDLIWAETLKRKAKYGGWEYDEEELKNENYEIWEKQ